MKFKEFATEDSAKSCPPATQDITLNLKNRQKAIDEYGYGPLNPDLPNNKFWMAKVDEWNLDSAEEAKASLCGNCAAFDQRDATLDCIAQGIGSDAGENDPTIEAGDLGYCRFLKFKCASRRTCDAWVTGGPLTDKEPVDENLHDWFGKEKWVRMDTKGNIKGPCARGSKSEGKPKCLPQAKAHALGKKGRASAAQKKRREDPDPERRGPAHNVATKVNEFAPGDGRDDEPHFNPETYYDIPKLKKVYKQLASRSVNSGWYDLQLRSIIDAMEELYLINADVLDEMFPTAPEIANYIERNIIKAFPSETPPYIIKNPDYRPRAPRRGTLDEANLDEKWSQKYKNSINCSHPKGFSQKAHCAGKRKHNEDITMEHVCPDCGMCETHGDHSRDTIDEACWKGYHREGNKKMFGKTYPNCVKNEGVAEGSETFRNKIRDALWYAYLKDPMMPPAPHEHEPEDMEQDEYEDFEENVDDILQFALAKNITNANLAVAKYSDLPIATGDEHRTIQEREGHESCPECGGAMYPEEMIAEKQDACYYKVKSRYKVWPSAYASGALVQCRKKGAANWGNKSKNESQETTMDELSRIVELSTGLSLEARAELAEEFDLIERIIDDLALHNGVDSEVIWEDLESLSDDELYVFATTTPVMESQGVAEGSKDKIYDHGYRDGSAGKPMNDKGYDGNAWGSYRAGYLDGKEARKPGVAEDWQKANKRDKTDGMSQKAVNSYRREHPGSKLKTAVTTKPSKLKKGSKASKRRKSYCSRSRGQMKMHNISCAKTPDKAICKARRRWNC